MIDHAQLVEYVRKEGGVRGELFEELLCDFEPVLVLLDALDDNGESLDRPDTESEPAERRFEFYELLPNMELIVPEEEYEVEADTAPQAVVEPGTYVLQAGSFTALNDAERRRAELGLQGIQSYIQRVTIDDKTYHRVRIGPTNDLDELNMLRSRLRIARIDVLRIRLGD